MAASVLLELSNDELLHLLDAIQRMTSATTDRDVDRTIESLLAVVAEATDCGRVSVYMVDRDAHRLLLTGHYPQEPDLARQYRILPLDGTHMGGCIAVGGPATWTIDEVDVDIDGGRAKQFGVRQLAAIPLRAQDRVIAVLNLARNVDRPYAQRELRFAQILGDLLVIYVENARLYADAQRRLEDIRMLLDVARTVSASLDLDQRLDASCEAVTRLLGASKATIFLLEQEDTILHGVATSSPELHDEIRSVRIRMTSEPCPAVRAVQIRRTVEEDGVLSVPLLVHGRPIGAILIEETTSPRTWTEPDVERAELIAQNVAVGIANSRLYDEVRRHAAQLEHAQHELLKRERLAALGQLGATLAHEVRNPLAVILNSLGTLGKTLPASGDAPLLLGIMREEALRLERLVRELLDFARPAAPSFELESLVAVVRDAVDAAKQEMGPTGAMVVIEAADDLPWLRLDRSMLRRAVLNVVVNGAQAAGPSGTVRVRATVACCRGHLHARLDVHDSGAGIPADVAPHVFEPFFTTKATGTGLGLAIVKGIVESHRGEVLIDSGASRGTTVTMLLPIDAPAAAR